MRTGPRDVRGYTLEDRRVMLEDVAAGVIAPRQGYSGMIGKDPRSTACYHELTQTRVELPVNVHQLAFDQPPVPVASDPLVAAVHGARATTTYVVGA